MAAVRRSNQRLNQILDTAESLFVTKSYEKTTINDILDGVGIGKGTFYHYFTAKSDVLDAVIDRMVENVKTDVQTIADLPELTAHQKFAMVFTEQGGRYNYLTDSLHHDENSIMHIKSLVETLRAISPAMTQIIQQGIAEGVYTCDYPQETFELLFSAAQFLLDPGLFSWSAEEILSRVIAFVRIIEMVLGTEPGSFDFFLSLITTDDDTNPGTSPIANLDANSNANVAANANASVAANLTSNPQRGLLP